MVRTRDLRVYPYFDEEEYEVNNAKMQCDMSPDTYRLYERRVLRRSTLNQVNYQEQRRFRRCTRQRDALLANNVDNCYKSRDNSYTRPTRGNRIRCIATSTITIDCSQLSSTKRCKDRDWQERLYYPWTRTTDENPTRSLPLTIKGRLRSSPRGDAIRRSSLTMRMKILWSDTRCPPTISANTYRNDCICYIEQDAFVPIDSIEVDSGRANTISANSVTNTYDATNADVRCKGYNYAELDECRKHCWCCTRHRVAIRNHYQSRTTIKRPGNVPIPNWSCGTTLTASFSLLRWQPGVPMNSTGGPQIPRLLDLEAVYTS